MADTVERERNVIVRGRSARVPLLLHGAVGAVVLSVAAVIVTAVLLIWLLG
jgi:hypothetical protein